MQIRDLVILDTTKVVFVDKLSHDVDGHSKLHGHQNGVHLTICVVKWEETNPSFTLDFLSSLVVQLWPSDCSSLFDICNQGRVGDHYALK